MITNLKDHRAGTLLVEFLILIAGINIALWFEGKFDDMKDARAEFGYLQGLRDDLAVDLAALDRLISQNAAKIDRLGMIMQTLPQLATADPNKQAGALFEPSSYEFFQPFDFTYRSMQESGDFRLLSDAQIKEDLLRLVRQYRHIELLQANFMQALDDEYIPLIMRGFDIAEKRVSDPELVSNQVFRNFFAFAVQDTSARVQAYEAARQQARILTDRITTTLNER